MLIRYFCFIRKLYSIFFMYSILLKIKSKNMGSQFFDSSFMKFGFRISGRIKFEILLGDSDSGRRSWSTAKVEFENTCTVSKKWSLSMVTPRLYKMVYKILRVPFTTVKHSEVVTTAGIYSGGLQLDSCITKFVFRSSGT